LHDVNFTTAFPWTQFPDGEGYSLVAKPETYKIMIKTASKWNATNVQFWRYSAKVKGSPWADDVLPVVRVPSVQISDINYNYPQTVTLHNVNKFDVDVGDWYITKDYSEHAHQITLGTVVKAYGKTVIQIPDFDLGSEFIDFQYQLFDQALFTKKDGSIKRVLTGDFAQFKPTHSQCWTRLPVCRVAQRVFSYNVEHYDQTLAWWNCDLSTQNGNCLSKKCITIESGNVVSEGNQLDIIGQVLVPPGIDSYTASITVCNEIFNTLSRWCHSDPDVVKWRSHSCKFIYSQLVNGKRDEDGVVLNVTLSTMF